MTAVFHLGEPKPLVCVCLSLECSQTWTVTPAFEILQCIKSSPGTGTPYGEVLHFGI